MELSEEIKKVVQEYYERQKMKYKDLLFEDAMARWFNEKFENWVMQRFGIKPRDDRRKKDRREEDKIEENRRKDVRRKADRVKITLEDDNLFNEERRRNKRRNNNRRIHNRFEIEIPVKIVKILNNSHNAEPDLIQETYNTFNISRGGLYFKTRDKLEESTMLKMVIDLSQVDFELDNVEAEVEIISVETLKNGEFGNRAVFKNIQDFDHKKNLDLFVFKSLVYQQDHMYRFY